MHALIITGPRPEGLAEALTGTSPRNASGCPGPEALVERAEELRAIYSTPQSAVDAVLTTVRRAAEHTAPRGSAAGLGIGLGSGDLLPPSGDEGSWHGPALDWSRAAAEQASGGRHGARLSVAGRDPALADAAEALLRLVARLVQARTTAEWRVVDLLVPGVRGQHRGAAEALGVTPQAVSKALLRTGWQEELDGRAAAAELLHRLDLA